MRLTDIDRGSSDSWYFFFGQHDISFVGVVQDTSKHVKSRREGNFTRLSAFKGVDVI